MSLFAGLFDREPAISSALFSEQSLFRRTGDVLPTKRKALSTDAQPGEAQKQHAELQPKRAAAGQSKASKAKSQAPAFPDVAEEELQPSPAPKRVKRSVLETAKEPAALDSQTASPVVAAKQSKKKKAMVAARPASSAPPAGKPAAGSPAADEDGPDDSAAVSGEAAKEGADVEAAAGPDKVRRKRTPEEEAERLQRTLFLGNLPVTVKAKLIKQMFSQYGEVESVRLRSLPLQADAGMPRRAAISSGRVDASGASANAYLVFRSRLAARAALAHNMQEFEGRHVRVDWAAQRSVGIRGGGTQVLYEPGRSVFVGNLPFDIQEEAVITLFGGGRGAGSVTAVRTVRDAKSGKGKGIAFVEFARRGDAQMALAVDGHQLNGRPIRVTKVARTGAPGGQQQPAAALSRLRTPFSKGVKAMQTSGGKGTPRHAATSGAPVWQGMRTKGAKKVSGGSAAQDKGAAAAGGAAAQESGAKRKAPGKRPAVASRKAQLQQSGKGQQKKKRK